MTALTNKPDQEKTPGDEKDATADAKPVLVALEDPDVPKVYANGFALGIGNADAHIVFQRFGRPVALVNLSYTLAKTLYDRMGQMVTEFEKQVDRKMLLTNQVDEAYKKDK